VTRHPYGPDELDRADPELDAVAHRLEAYAAAERGDPPLDLATRIQAAVEEEPAPSPAWWVALAAGLRAWRGPARAVAAVAVVVAAVVGAMAVGELAERARRNDVGTSPLPTPVATPSETPSPTFSPSPTLSPSPTPSETPSPSPTDSRPPFPTASDDAEIETPEPDGGNSGPGGGDDGDNSGPGGGDDGDNSGPGGG